MGLVINEIEVDYCPVVNFSKRETEVINGAMRGGIAKEIANDLFLSVRTVETHFKNAKMKAGAKNMSHLIYIFMMSN